MPTHEPSPRSVGTWRVALGNRVGRRPPQTAATTGPAGPADASLDTLVKRRTRCAGATANLTQHYRLELSALRGPGATALPAPLGLCRWVHPASHRDDGCGSGWGSGRGVRSSGLPP